MKRVYIESVAHLVCDPSYPSSELKTELETHSGQKFRRINRYILLGLSGVYSLNDVDKIDATTSLYIGTKNGCINETVSMLGQIYRDSMLPMPFTFIASSSNMASYHIANSLGLSGGNYTFSHPNSPFEVAMETAFRDILREKTDSVLVGCIDEAAHPLEAFKKRVGMEAIDSPLEGGYWMHLTARPSNPIAEIVENRVCKSIEEVKQFIPLGANIIMDDSSSEGEKLDYIGSNSGLRFTKALLLRENRPIALISRMGRRYWSLILVNTLSESDYNLHN